MLECSLSTWSFTVVAYSNTKRKTHWDPNSNSFSKNDIILSLVYFPHTLKSSELTYHEINALPCNRSWIGQLDLQIVRLGLFLPRAHIKMPDKK